MSNFSVFEAGTPSEWLDGQFSHPAFQKPVRGKQFLSDALGLTGMELSLNVFPPRAAMPFVHSHRENEELYLVLAGEGEFLVDGERIALRPGTAIRVAPDGKRIWRNTGEEPLVYIVVQAKQDSLAARTIVDGKVEAEPPPWAASR